MTITTVPGGWKPGGREEFVKTPKELQTIDLWQKLRISGAASDEEKRLYHYMMAHHPPRHKPKLSTDENSPRPRRRIRPRKLQSFVYFIRRGSDGPVKIGLSQRPKNRLAALQCAHPEELILVKIVPGDWKREKSLHRKYAAQHIRGEWFRFCDEMMNEE